EVNRVVRHVGHGQVVDGDVFENSAVHFFKSEATATAEGAIGHRAIAEAAARLGAELDAAQAVFRRLHGAVEQCAFEKAGHLAVDDGEIFRNARFAERAGGLGANAVVNRRIHATVEHGGVAAAIKVHAVAVGVEGDVVNRQVVAAGDENGKMAAVKNRDVADQNIPAQLEGDGFVADAHGRIGFGIRRGKMFVTAHLVEDFGIPLQPAAVDHAVAGDENIGEVFAPDEAVVKITMSAI